MAKLFVIAGHGNGDPGACSYNYSEAERVRALATRMKEIGGASVQLGDFNRNYYADKGILNLGISKDYQIIELHMDSASSSARGGHVVIKDGFNPDQYDNALAKFISTMFPGRSVIISKRSDLANVNRAAQVGYSYRLLECCFISNYDDLTKFNNQMDTLAIGILNAFGISSQPQKRNMSEAAMQPIVNQVYTGNECKPAMTSSAGATFDVSYRDNVTVGWGTAVATGNGNWVGTAETKFKILPNTLVRFNDVDPSAWYLDDVRKVVENGIMSGTSESTFVPDGALTRAMAVAVISRAAGVVEDSLPYSDVEQAPWYYEAAKWATDEGILKGSDGKMRPNDACTRAEFVVMLCRWIGKESDNEHTEFSDWGSVPDYAKKAFAWAVESDIVTGSNGMLRPNDSCTRAMAAAMINRIG